MEKLIRVAIMIFISLGSIIAPLKIEAANGGSFSVSPILPDSQLDKSKAYFDLRMEPKQKKTIEIEVSNTLGKDQVIIVDSSAARSNQNGIIEYTSNNENKDNSLVINFTDIINFQKEVTVPANSTIKVPIEITMPDKLFDGIILGGLTFKTKNNESEGDQNQITNKFAYSIAVMISQNDSEISPELNLQSVDVGQSNLRNVIRATVQNETATIVENLEMEAFVYKGTQNEPIFHNQVINYRMAPNSTLPFVINTNDKPLKAGRYTLKMTAKSDEKEWEWEKKFTIEADVARQLNSTAVSLETDNTLMYILIGAVFIGLFIVIIILCMREANKRKKKKNKRNKRNKRSI